MSRNTDKLIQISAATGGSHLNASFFSRDELISIASATSNHEARLIIDNTNRFLTDDLVEIAAAGKGAVLFQKNF